MAHRDLVADDAEIRLFGDAETVVSDIQYDSRLVTPGDLCIAISGGHFDGHDFIGSAIERGAVADFTERQVQPERPTLVVAKHARPFPGR
jgi:UDP-N-acetylmuramoyl-L-alanyl-D-glutamate--2,6-diaminopimelate ligase